MSLKPQPKPMEPGDFLTLDNEFRLFVWALFRAGVLTTEQAKSALLFIRKVRVEEIPLKVGLEECQEIEVRKADQGDGGQVSAVPSGG